MLQMEYFDIYITMVSQNSIDTAANVLYTVSVRQILYDFNIYKARELVNGLRGNCNSDL